MSKFKPWWTQKTQLDTLKKASRNFRIFQELDSYKVFVCVFTPGSRRAAGCPELWTVWGNARPDSRTAGCRGCCTEPWRVSPGPDRTPSPPCFLPPLQETQHLTQRRVNTHANRSFQYIHCIETLQRFQQQQLFNTELKHTEYWIPIQQEETLSCCFVTEGCINSNKPLTRT